MVRSAISLVRPPAPRPARSRPAVGAAVLAVIVVGVASRTVGARLPELIAKDLGDVLWAVMFYLLALLVRPRASPIAAGAVALSLAAGTEILKLYEASWIETLRGVWGIGFLLGRRFLWSNFVAYGIGAAAAACCDLLVARRRAGTRSAASRP